MCGPLRHLFVTSLRKHTIPLDWHTHVIISVYKSAWGQIPSKRLPSHIITLYYFKNTRIINPQQDHPPYLKFPYTPPIWILKKQIHNSFDVIISSGHQSDMIYFNFKKAFDSVPHNELLLKLKSMGISGNLWLWFKSYLSNRQQCVKLNNKYSHLLPVLSGILQGSILARATSVSHLH